MDAPPESALEICILGPLEVRVGGEPLELGGGRQRALLAILALHANEVVSADRLVDELWGEAPPATAAKSLQNLVGQLRRALEPVQNGVLETRAPGYVLRLPPDAVDAHRFARRAAAARAQLPTDPEGAAARLREALALWRGDALAEFAYESFAQREIARLEELKLNAQEDRIDADLAAGRDAVLVPELEELVAAQPLRERPVGQLMLALYRSGRQADALEAYRRARQALHDQLGLEPGAQLRLLEQAILTQDPALGPLPRLPSRLLRTRRRRLGALLGAVAVLAGAGLAAALLVTRGSGLVIVPDSLLQIDAATNEVVGVVRVGSEPGPVVVAGDFVFVTSARDSTLSRVDRRTGEVVTAGGFATPRGLAADGRDSLWVVNERRSEVVAIDVETMDEFARLAVPSPAALGNVAVGGGSIWLNEWPPGAVSRWRLPTLELQRRYLLEIGAAPIDGSFAAGAAWFALVHSGELLRIDPDDGTTSRVRVGSNPGGPPQGGFSSIWATTESDGVWRLDPVTGQVRAVIRVGRNAWGLAIGSGSVWVANHDDGTVSRIDPAADRVVATITTGFFPQWLAADDRYVWVGLSGTRWDGLD